MFRVKIQYQEGPRTVCLVPGGSPLLLRDLDLMHSGGSRPRELSPRYRRECWQQPRPRRRLYRYHQGQPLPRYNRYSFLCRQQSRLCQVCSTSLARHWWCHTRESTRNQLISNGICHPCSPPSMSPSTYIIYIHTQGQRERGDTRDAAGK